LSEHPRDVFLVPNFREAPVGDAQDFLARHDHRSTRRGQVEQVQLDEAG
jgi:hypothetical protein